MMRRKIQRMMRGYIHRGAKISVSYWDGPYHPTADFIAYRSYSHWAWSHPIQSTPLADMQRIKAFVHQFGIPIV
jgi:hypothetical protein